MNKTKYTIYWTGEDSMPYSMTVFSLQEALSEMEKMRTRSEYYRSIAFCSENPDQVGKSGVDAVVNGVLPDGQEYVYKTGRGQGND